MVYSRAFPAILLPFGVWVANYGWTVPEGEYVGDLTIWVIFAFLLGVSMWQQDRVNLSYCDHWMFLPIVALYNGFTFGLAMVLVLAGSTTPDGAIIVFFVAGTVWAIYVIQKISVYRDGAPLDETKLKKTLIFLLLACCAFVLVASGVIDPGVGGALGFQFLILLPIYESMDIDPIEDKVRKAFFFVGGMLLIGYEFTH